MELTLIIAIVSILIGLLLVLGFVGVLGAATFFMLRGRRSAATRPEEPSPSPKKPEQRVAPDAPTERQRLPKPPIAAAPSATPPPPPSLPPPPPGSAGQGLIGFFDDEPMDTDSAKTELFQRGAAAFGFDDDSDELDEGEATEIFSAHGPAGDMGEFAFDQDPEISGRLRSPDRK